MAKHEIEAGHTRAGNLLTYGTKVRHVRRCPNDCGNRLAGYTGARSQTFAHREADALVRVCGLMSVEQEQSDPVRDTHWLTHQWVVAGIVSAAARFIPIPFIDDVVREQCRRFVVSRTLTAHDTALATSNMKPFYSDNARSAGRWATSIAKAPLKLLLFPVRKFVAIATSVRGVPLEVMRMVLFGRTLDRCLADKRWPDDRWSDDPQLPRQMKSAFETAFARMDFRVLRATIRDALSTVSGWKSSAMGLAQQVAGPRDAETDGLGESSEVKLGAEKIEHLLGQPETLRLFAEFDRRFDEALQRKMSS